MNIPYRTRRFLKSAGIVLLILLLAGALVYLCWFLWLQRYVVYTRDDGAVINMDQLPHVPDGNPAVEPEKETVSIYYNEGENAINTSKEMTQLVGYYADEELLADMALVEQQVSILPTGTPVMLDVKDGKGRFFYSSAISGDRKSSIDPVAMDALIEKLDKKGMYLIAKLPAFRDYSFGLNHTENGLFVASGAYLWADDDYCYWLDPTKQGTVTYLVEIVTELKKLGFDEVVFDNYCFPNVKDLKFSGDRAAALNATANTLVTTCADSSFAVSFVGGAEGFSLPQGRSRLYLRDVAAIQAATVAQQSGVADPAINLVFLTEIHDTRFNEFSVLRPLDSAG